MGTTIHINININRNAKRKKIDEVKRKIDEIIEKLENTSDLTVREITELRKYVGRNVQTIYSQLRRGLMKRNCPNCKSEIIDSRDIHWSTNLVCAKCCAKANNCKRCHIRQNDYQNS